MALTRKIYQHAHVLVNEVTNDDPWHITFFAMFHLSNDSHLFQNAPGPNLLPLYEAKMIQMYDHRSASVVYVPGNAVRQNQQVATTAEQYRTLLLCRARCSGSRKKKWSRE